MYEGVDDCAQLLLFWWYVKLLHDVYAGGAVNGRIRDNIPSRVQILIVLFPLFFLVIAVCDGVTGRRLEGSCFACTCFEGFLHTVIDTKRIPAVSRLLDAVT